MEQTPSSAGRSPELPSVSPPTSGEMKGGIASNPEISTGAATERQEQSGGGAPRTEQLAQPPVVLPIPVVIPLPADDSVTPPPLSDTPTVANDDELIEKEWVERAKKVIADTKDDPYLREQEVSRLQADYLAKRYGRKLGSLQGES